MARFLLRKYRPTVRLINTVSYFDFCFGTVLQRERRLSQRKEESQASAVVPLDRQCRTLPDDQRLLCVQHIIYTSTLNFIRFLRRETTIGVDFQNMLEWRVLLCH